MFLERYLEELQDEGKPIAPAKLINLSGLSRTEMDLFRRAWGGINIARRRKLVSLFGQLARDNFDLDFCEVLLVCLADPDPEVREQAIAGIAEDDDRRLIAPLVGTLKGDPVDRVRAASAATLGKFALLAEFGKLLTRDTERLTQALQEVIEDPNETDEVRRRAIEAIAPLSLQKVRGYIWQTYQSPNPKMRASAVYAMSRNCTREWLPIIIKELKNQDPEIRQEAVRACGELGDRSVVPYLIPLTRDRDSQVQIGAIEALSKVGGGMARHVLRQLANGEDVRVRELARNSLDSMNMEEEPLGYLYST